MFLMDSVNAGKRNTKRSLAFLKALVEELDIDQDNIHVGLMSAECEPDNPGFSLKAHSTVKSIQTAVDTMKVMDIHSIIHKMRRKAFSTTRGGRKHAKKIAILIIDGSLEEPLKTLREAQRARIRGVEVFVIQVNLMLLQPILNLPSCKRDVSGVWSGFTLFALNTRISIKHVRFWYW